MRRRPILVLLIAGTLSALPASPVDALSVPHPPKPSQLTVSGFIVGRVAKGNLIRFGILASDPRSWGDLHSVKVILLLHGQSLQEMTFFVKENQFKLGDQRAVSITSSEPVVAGFLRVNPHTVRRIRHTFSIRVTFWARIREAIPRGTTFRVIARDEAGNISYAREKVGVSGGFLTWGTFAIGFVLALLIGVFVTNLRYSRRLRERRPSIWEILERRLREERARPPALVGVGGNGGLE
ncbi:MAG TPA: hypothetical protein VGL18_13510 [Actinomycetota bacterium]|jgi:hypothetical protein